MSREIFTVKEVFEAWHKFFVQRPGAYGNIVTIEPVLSYAEYGHAAQFYWDDVKIGEETLPLKASIFLFVRLTPAPQIDVSPEALLAAQCETEFLKTEFLGAVRTFQFIIGQIIYERATGKVIECGEVGMYGVLSDKGGFWTQKMFVSRSSDFVDAERVGDNRWRNEHASKTVH